MSSVDNRIVRMEFQNSDFERNLQTSEESLKKFDSFLKSFGDSGVSSALDKISDKFSTLGIIGVTALQNITNQAIDTGKQLIKSLTTDNISSGWAKLENQTKAVGTLVSQGFDISEVNEQLDKLQWYTDETSYNFNDMLTAVSKFTAQGKGLSESVSALEGIANWAAIAGQNATAGSSAMRELSQAVGVGYVRQQDWSSIQTLMMDYDGLRDMVLESAVAMGTLKKNADGTYQSLVSLTNQGATAFTKAQMVSYMTTGRWFTTDVLMSVLNQFSEAVEPVYQYIQENNVTAAEAIEALSGTISDTALGFFRAAQEARTFGDAIDSVREGVASGWQKTFGILLGDYEQQRELWTDLADKLYEVFVEGGNARNEMLQAWADLDGREKLIRGIWNIFDAGVKIVDTVKRAFRNIFPPKTAKQLLNITEKFETFTEKLIISDETAEKIGRTLQGVFSIFRLGRDVIYAFIKPFASLVGSSNGLADSILTVSAHIGDTIANFVHMIETSDKLKVVSEAVSKVLSGLGIVIGAIGTGIGTVVKKAKDLTKNLSSPLKKIENNFDSATKSVEGFISGLGFMKNKEENIVTITQAAEGLVSAFTDEEIINAPEKLGKIGQAFKDLGTGIKSKYETYIKPAFDGIKDFLSTNIFNSSLFSGIAKILGAIVAFRFVWGLADLITAIPSAIANVIKSLGALSGILNGLALSLKGTGYLKYAAAIGIVVASLWALTKIDTERIWDALSVVKDVMAQLNEITLSSIASLWVLSKIDLTPFLVSMGILAGVIFAIHELSPILEELGISIKDAFSEENLDKFFNFMERFVSLLTGMTGLGVGIAVIKLISTLEGLAKAAKNFGNFTINVFKTDTSWAAKMLKFTAAIGIVAISIIALGKLNREELEQGATLVAGIATFMTAASLILTASTSDLANVANIGKSMLQMSIGIGIISLAMKVLGSFSSDEINTSLIALAGVALFIGILAVIGKGTDSAKLGVTGSQLVAIGVAIIELAVGMVILSAAIKVMATIGLEEMGSALLGVVGSLLMMTFALVAVSDALDGRSALNIIGIAFAFDMLSASLMVISASILALSNLQWYETLSGATSLAIALVGMGLSLSIVGEAVSGLKALGAVVSILGMVGVIYLLAKAFQEFEKINADALTGITIALSILIVVMGAFVTVIMAVAEACPVGGIIIVGVLALIALTCVAAGEAISKIIGAFESFAVTIANRGPDIADGITLIANSVADGILNISKSIAEGIATIAAWPALAISKVVEGIGSAIEKIKGVLAPSTNSLGEYMIEGIGNGMQNKKSKGILGKAADVALKILFGKWGVNSPSTEGYYVGEMWNEGIAGGMEENTVVLERAAEGTLNTIIDEFVTGGSDAASAFNNSLAENVDMSMFEGMISDYMTNSGMNRLKDSSSIMGVSLSTSTTDAMIETMTQKLPDVDSTSASFLDSLIGNSKSNWAASEWGKSQAESTALSYSDGLSKAIVIIDHSLAEKQLSTITATSKFADALSQIRVAGSDVSSIAKAANNSLSESRKSANALLSKFSTYEADDPLHIGGSYTALVNSNRELRTSQGILSDVNNTTTDMLSDSVKWAEELRRKINNLFVTTKDRDITPTIDYDEMTTNIQNALNSGDYSIDVKASIDPESEKSLEDWELSTEELIRKYAKLSKSFYDGEWHDMWAYNGPRSGYAYENDEYEYEWVYEGPSGGEYDAKLDKYYATVNGELYNISEWTSDLRDAYYGHTDQIVDTITQNTSEIANTLKDQTNLESKHNSDVLNSISGLSAKLDGIDTGIEDLGDDISNLKLYLDGDKLVGGLSDRIDSSLGTTQKLKSQGVLR